MAMPRAASTSGGPPMPMALPRVANTTSDIPAMLALPANERPDTTETVGTHPDISAIPSNVPTSLFIAAPKNPALRRPWARAPPPSAKHTNGKRWRIARSMIRSIFEWLMPVCVPPHTV
jgi:hypothetical protein